MLLGPTLLAVPVEFLSDEEAIRLGRYPGATDPAELERLFQIGGIALAGKLGDILAAMEKHPSEIRSHNMYFLLRLTNN